MNPEILPQVRKRVYKPKSRGGCKTCKVRRIKCDESKPSCRRCTSTGRKCDGYDEEAHLTPLPVPCIVLEDPKSTSLAISAAPSFASHICKSPREQRSFAFFQERTIPQLSSVFQSQFWNRYVLQASYHELSIRHALVALGSLHECCMLGDSRTQWSGSEGERLTFATGQYAKAVSYFVESTKRHSKRIDMILTTCVLFICFELLRCQQGSALTHIDGGTTILEEYQQQASLTEDKSHCVPVATLRSIFVRLDSQASQIHYGRRPLGLSRRTSHKNESAIRPNQSSGMIEDFQNLEDARDSLDNIWAAVTRSLGGGLLPNLSPSEMIEGLARMRKSTQDELSQWHQSFKTLVQQMKSNGPLDAANRNTINTMKLQWVTSRTLVSMAPKSYLDVELGWDQCHRDFEVILSLAESILNFSKTTYSDEPSDLGIEPRKEETNHSEHSFCLDIGIIFPIYFVATKCRHRGIRRRALAQLKGAQRQEGLWNSNLLAKCAAIIIDLEEGNNTEDISGEERIGRVQVAFGLGARKAKLGFVRCGLSPNNGLRIHERVLEW